MSVCEDARVCVGKILARAEAKEQYIVKTLLQRARAGDADAFADLFQSHADGLWRTAMAVLREEQSAADTLQETAIKAWRSIPSFQGTSSLGTWLTRILLNTCFDAQRGEGRIIPFADIACPESPEHANNAQPLNIQPFPGIDRTVSQLDTDTALSALSESDRAILALFYGDDLPLKEVAAALGIAEGAARTRLSRARARFKDAYLKADHAQGDPVRIKNTPIKEAIS